MQIKEDCILTSSTSNKAAPVIGRKGRLTLVNGSPMVFISGNPGSEYIIRTSPVKWLGVAKSNIFATTVDGTRYTFEFR